MIALPARWPFGLDDGFAGDLHNSSYSRGQVLVHQRDVILSLLYFINTTESQPTLIQSVPLTQDHLAKEGPRKIHIADLSEPHRQHTIANAPSPQLEWSICSRSFARKEKGNEYTGNFCQPLSLATSDLIEEPLVVSATCVRELSCYGVLRIK